MILHLNDSWISIIELHSFNILLINWNTFEISNFWFIDDVLNFLYYSSFLSFQWVAWTKEDQKNGLL